MKVLLCLLKSKTIFKLNQLNEIHYKVYKNKIY